MKFNENDKVNQTKDFRGTSKVFKSNSHIFKDKRRFEPFSYLYSIFRVIIFAQNLASHVGGIEFNSIESFADISFMLGEDFLLCQDKI